MDKTIANFPRVASGNRTFVNRECAPFFWLADTAWAAPGRAEWEEWTRYIDVRAEQGFNVVQVNALPQHDASKPIFGPRRPFAQTASGGWDYDRLDPSYFIFLERMVRYANEKGLTVGVVVLWFVHVPGARERFRPHPEGMAITQARRYTEHLVALLADHDVVWIISGDDDFVAPGVTAFYHEIGELVQELDQRDRLITAHPAYMSGRYFHGAGWLDFNMVQSSHDDRLQHQAYEFVEEEWRRMPPKPLLNAEPCYEAATSWHSGRIFHRHDVRKASWWSVVEGATAGITYGTSGVWAWIREGDDRVRKRGGPELPTWEESLPLPGAEDMVRMKDLLLSLPWHTLEPASRRLRRKSQAIRLPVAASPDGHLLLAYVGESMSFDLDLEGISDRARAEWWNPADGSRKPLAKVADGVTEFSCPWEQDGLLIVHAPTVGTKGEPEG